MDPRLRGDDGRGEKRMKQPCIYILASGKHGTLSIGARSDPIARTPPPPHSVIPAKAGIHKLDPA